MIDFTVADAAVSNVRSGAKYGAALVIGTTGFTPAQRVEMAKCNQRACSPSSNFKQF